MFWALGKHSIWAGVDYLNYYANDQFHQNFPGTITQINKNPLPTNAASQVDLSSLFPNPTDPSTWNIAGISSYVAQYAQGFGQSGISIYRSQLSGWVQDDWKFLPRLTLNLGIRYDVDIGMTNDGPYLKSGLTTPHSGDYDNIGPRFGFAYDVFGTHKTVVRGGAGIYYADLEANPYYDQQLFNGQASIQASVIGTVNLAKPFGNVTTDQILSGQVTFPQAVQLVQPGVVTPWSAQGSIGAAQQIGRWSFTADYIKFRTHELGVRVDLNQALNLANGYTLLNSTSSAPAYVNSGFTSILRFQTPSNTAANTNELQVAVRLAYTSGITVSLAYTLASQRSNTEGLFFVPNNQFNLKDGWGPIAGDQRHTLNGSATYQLKYGFQIAGLVRYGSGSAFAITAGSTLFLNGTSSNRTYLASKKTYDDPSWNHASIAPGYLTVNRNAFYGQPIYRFDGHVQKTFAIHERHKVILLAEGFNLTNHPNYGSYQTDITTSVFGQPTQNTGLAYAPREFQLAARFEF